MREILFQTIQNRTLQKLTLSKSTNKQVLRTAGRLISIKGKIYLALETFCADGKALQKNVNADSAADVVSALLPGSYKQLNIITTGGNCEIKFSKKNKMTILNQIKDTNSQKVQLYHNRKKQYILSDREPIDFLLALGVQDSNGCVFDKKRAKFRQINRFLEIVSDVESSIVQGEELYILDLCCGKSYLSFALYYYFTQLRGCRVQMDCVDLKSDVIAYCDETAKKLGYEGLHFYCEDIRNFKIRRTPDLTVSLHACDIATDIVLAKAMDSGSRVILSTPCCHHEMMGQLKPTGNPTDLLLKHSILKQKLADAATDALRCKVLEINGYAVTALELIDPEETPKNVLIRGIRRKEIRECERKKLIEEYENLCQLLGVKPYLQAQYVK